MPPNHPPDYQPETLFYPVSEDALRKVAVVWPVLLLPIFLILPLIVPALLFYYPLAFIACKLANKPFSFHPKILDNILKSIPGTVQF